MKDDKKFLRERKKQMKRTGNRKRRQYLKQQLTDPDPATDDKGFEFGYDRSEILNGKDKDSTRKRKNNPRD